MLIIPGVGPRNTPMSTLPPPPQRGTCPKLIRKDSQVSDQQEFTYAEAWPRVDRRAAISRGVVVDPQPKAMEYDEDGRPVDVRASLHAAQQKAIRTRRRTPRAGTGLPPELVGMEAGRPSTAA